MESEDLREIETLTKRFIDDEPVASEYEEVIQRITEAGDPLSLPALRKALSAAIGYQARSEALAERTPTDFKKNAPGGWIVDAMPVYAKQYVASLRAAIEACTPAGEAVVYEPAKAGRRWWRRRTPA